MIITTIEEIRLYLPNHQLNDIQGLRGFVDSSERDFLSDKLGRELFDAMQKEYDKITPDELLPENAQSWTAWIRLIRNAQAVVMFDALYRSADLNVISLNDAGMNIASTDDYASAGENLIEKFKSRCNKEAHRAVDRMLVLLEEWAREVGEIPAEKPDEDQKITIIRLWQKSRYYYLDAGLFISTATQMQEYLDIYDSREKFVSLIPNIRYAQSVYVAAEIGQSFTAYLIKAKQQGKLNATEQQLADQICWWIAFVVEHRSKLFTRKEAAEDAVKMRQSVIGFIRSNYDAFKDNIGIDSPLYVAPVTQPAAPSWENNRPGSKLFVTPPVDMKP